MALENDGVSLQSTAHPVERWWKRPMFMVKELFGMNQFSKSSVETVGIEVSSTRTKALQLAIDAAYECCPVDREDIESPVMSEKDCARMVRVAIQTYLDNISLTVMR